MAGGASSMELWRRLPSEPRESLKTALLAVERASRQHSGPDSISGQKRSAPCAAFSAEAQQINDRDKVPGACRGLRRWRGRGLARLKCCQNTCLAAFSLVSPLHVCCRAAAVPRLLPRRRTLLSCFRSRLSKMLIYHMAASHPCTCTGEVDAL